MQWFLFQTFFDNSTGFQISKNLNSLPPTFTHTFTPNDFKITDSQAMQDLGKYSLYYFTHDPTNNSSLYWYKNNENENGWNQF